ncbi:MAG: recombination protein O N-terminal domain-containing protein [Akkermansia sp.]|nr:recombination protein O N-terminal domain-containing protein [Akkermansia sp.]
MEKDTGTILRLNPLGESGVIVSWCTAHKGIVRTAARNARKPGSDLSGSIDLFHECELVYRPATGRSDLHSLNSATLLTPRLPLRSSLTRLRLCSYMAQLLLVTVENESGDSAWHNLISGALDYVATHPPRLAILHHFEKRLATLHGLYTPDQSAHHCLQRHFQHLPAGRAELLEALKKAQS